MLPWRLTREEADALNPPDRRAKYIQGRYYLEIVDDPDWLDIGYVPVPRTRRGWFVHHLLHGMLMRYPFWKVIGFALWNAFIDDLDDDGGESDR